MIYVGIDVAKDKHDCFVTSSDGKVLFPVFTIQNNREGFDDLFSKIQSVSSEVSNIKVGLEATGHYSYNLLGYLIDKGLPTYVINPLHTNLYRKSLSLRKTKTDKVDARTIAMMLMSDVNLKSYSDTSYHNEALKSLTRYRFDKVQERARLKQSVSRLVNVRHLWPIKCSLPAGRRCIRGSDYSIEKLKKPFSFNRLWISLYNFRFTLESSRFHRIS